MHCIKRSQLRMQEQQKHLNNVLEKQLDRIKKLVTEYRKASVAESK
jgi:ClpP class serine protease